MVEPVVSATPDRPHPRPALGYAMVWIGATLFAINGSVAKVALESDLGTEHLTLARSAGACAALGLVLVAVAPRTLRLRRRDLPFLVLYGVAGLAFVQWFYFVAIHRLPVGIALLIEYLAPLLIALWVRFALRRHVRRRVWAAAALAVLGLALVVEVWHGLALDGIGVAAALAGAVSFAVYILLAERAVGTRDPLSLSFYGFLFAALFWAVLRPPWTFPADALDTQVALVGSLGGAEPPVWALLLWIVVLGTIVPFALVVGALRHIPAPQVAVVATLEPVVAAVVAWLWLGEALGAPQLAGGAIVLVAIVLAQTARPPAAAQTRGERPRSSASS